MQSNDDCNYESYPLSSINQLYSWCPSATERAQILRLTTGKTWEVKRLKGPKVLLCHDMQGGYLDDRLVHGSDNASAYRFTKWSLIDYFVYFSHNLVTIPPCGWIDVAHRHGVEVLGTFITEFKNGKLIFNELFRNEDTVDKLVAKLLEIEKFYQFDGWLINIENDVTLEQVHLLRHFLCKLKAAEKNPVIIWYDSVKSTTGKLAWQNELNEHNKQFFDLCDGIFLNYRWNDGSLSQSKLHAFRKHNADTVGNDFPDSDKIRLERRDHDLFVGIDVFGRGCYGGGGWNCKLALEKIRKFDLSVAIFAPGWVYECNNRANFAQNDLRFWQELGLKQRHLPMQLPFETHFCQGFGHGSYLEGIRSSDSSWNCLRSQNLQVNHLVGHIDTSDAYNGGGCIRITDLTQALLRCHFRCRHPTGIIIQLLYKCTGSLSIECSASVPVDTCSISVNNVDGTRDNAITKALKRNDMQMTAMINGWTNRYFHVQLASSSQLVGRKKEAGDNDDRKEQLSFFIHDIYLKYDNKHPGDDDSEQPIHLGKLKIIQVLE